MYEEQTLNYRQMLPLVHDQLNEPIHFGSSNNQVLPGSDLNMHTALHYVSLGEANAGNTQ